MGLDSYILVDPKLEHVIWSHGLVLRVTRTNDFYALPEILPVELIVLGKNIDMN